MPHLDNRSLIKQIDVHNYLSHLVDIPSQLVDGYTLGASQTIPALFAQAKQLVILTAGETLPVAYALEALMIDYARIPVVIVSDFLLPHWVGSDSLVVALDYTGDNEQVLRTFHEAAKRRSRLLAVSVAGDLAKEARRFRATHIAINYGAPSRAAFYYIFACLAAVFKKLDFIEMRESFVSEASVLCRSMLQTIHPEIDQYKNSAKQLAEKIVVRKPVIVSARPLRASAKKWRINLAATGKMMATVVDMNEFTTSFIDSLGTPVKTNEPPMVLMLQSKYDFPRVKLHQTLSYQVAQARKILYEQIFMHPSGSLLSEICLVAAYGDMVSYYVALLFNQDPSFDEASLYIKEQLANQPIEE